MLSGPRTDFAIVANGFADGPAQALRDYLVGRGASVLVVLHPLTPEQGRTHVIERYSTTAPVERRSVGLPIRPPLSYLADPLVPLLPPGVGAWFGFNPLACARGLAARRLGRAGFVGLWSVDFVPDRFGPGTPATRLYDRLDRYCCVHADARIELSEAARDARDRRHGLRASSTPTHVVPMGVWLDRSEPTPADGLGRRRVVFVGHLVERQGVDVLLAALALLRTRGTEVAADVVGTGPLAASLRDQARALGLEDVVRFHGFLASHRDVERILAGASVGVAPYRPGGGTFTRYADPGKLKAYLGAGLPVVLTDVPPNAGELAREAGAEIAAFDAAAIADAVSRALESPASWRERRRRALAYARRFDWSVLFDDLLERLDLQVPARAWAC